MTKPSDKAFAEANLRADLAEQNDALRTEVDGLKRSMAHAQALCDALIEQRNSALNAQAQQLADLTMEAKGAREALELAKVRVSVLEKRLADAEIGQANQQAG